MKYFKLLFLSAVILTPARANPASCAVTTLTAYLAPDFSCVIGDKTFTSFAASLTAVTALGTATPASTDSITVTPTGDSSDPAFSFSALFDAGTTSTLTVSSVTFTVAYTGFAPADDPFTQINLFLTNPQVTGLGLITPAEALCENGTSTLPLDPLGCGAVVVNSGLTSNIDNGNLDATISFSLAALTELGVIKQLTLTSGLGGTATADAVNNSLQATLVPEPSRMALLLAGMVALPVCRRRFRGRQKKTGR